MQAFFPWTCMSSDLGEKRNLNACEIQPQIHGCGVLSLGLTLALLDQRSKARKMVELDGGGGVGFGEGEEESF